jgi:predicted SprT family Zn-dependent metalloprotease
MQQYIEYLDLKMPIVLKVNTRANKTMDGFYVPKYSAKTGNLLEHRITIYTKNASRDFNTLVAHELIHAWQEENKKSEIHGKFFKALAKDMGEYFGLQNVYIKGVDVN